MEFEYTEPEYDEEEDGYEIRQSREKYEEESANLLAKIEERDKLIKLLKLAKPDRIKVIRSEIARLDKYIEATERIVEHQYELYQKRQQLWKDDMRLMAMVEVIRPALIKHVAENNPEKLELLEAMLSDDDKTH